MRFNYIFTFVYYIGTLINVDRRFENIDIHTHITCERQLNSYGMDNFICRIREVPQRMLETLGYLSSVQYRELFGGSFGDS